MRIVLIGAGRVATNMGHALQAAGHEVMAVYSRTMASATALATALNAMATDDAKRLPLEADVFIMSIKDSVLRALAEQLTKDREGQLFVHTAGSMPMTLFDGLTTRYGVLYPMQTFSKERLLDFSDIPLFVEACDDTVLDTVRRLAESLSQHVYDCTSEQRKMLHLAAVFACNFANHCYALSAALLERHGLPFDIMLPLIDETTRKIHQLHPLDAQTGPAVRWDENVIGMQSQLLAYDPAVRELYEQLSESIHKKAISYGQLRLKEDTSHRV